MSGTLFVVATPIGNLEEITFRAINILKTVDYILAEDTRHSARLLNHFDISTKMKSYHKFSEKQHLNKIIEELQNNKNIALISDAGTPAISDPGKYLVKEVLEKKIKVVPIAGASASTMAFSVSGSLSDTFFFNGFLPSKGAERQTALNKCFEKEVPFVIYESPNRINNLLKELEKTNSRIVVCREISKQFEEIFVYDKEKAVKEKGEFTVVVEPMIKNEETDIEKDEIWETLTHSKVSMKNAIKILERIFPKTNKNRLKQIFLKKSK